MADKISGKNLAEPCKYSLLNIPFYRTYHTEILEVFGAVMTSLIIQGLFNPVDMNVLGLPNGMFWRPAALILKALTTHNKQEKMAYLKKRGEKV